MNDRRLDPLSLVAGLLFAGLGIAFALDAKGTIELDVTWIWPIVLIAIGIGWMLAGSGWGRRDR